MGCVLSVLRHGQSYHDFMPVKKAVITAAAKNQRALPMQTLFDHDGVERSVLSLIVREVALSGIGEIGIVIWPEDRAAYEKLLIDDPVDVTFIPQAEARGYAHAVLHARQFVGSEPFLHCVGDHIYAGSDGGGSAKQLVELAQSEACAVSGVQVTRENLLPYFGCVGGQAVAGKTDVYLIDTVLEKPTPTEAEQKIVVPGLRAGQYLCFFGMHVLTPSIFDILEKMLRAAPSGAVSLSSALGELARRERYLAMIQKGRRFDVGVKYGLFNAQLALALSGRDRDQILTELIGVLAARNLFSRPGVEA
jgi:UTP--glucose-1-phosphate uridylyltransferase